MGGIYPKRGDYSSQKYRLMCRIPLLDGDWLEPEPVQPGSTAPEIVLPVPRCSVARKYGICPACDPSLPLEAFLTAAAAFFVFE